MARNLREKILPTDTLIVYDVNSNTVKQFAEEIGNTSVAKDVAEAAEKSVSSR